MRQIIGKLLIIVGTLIISSIIYINYITSKNNNTLIRQYKNEIKVEEKYDFIEELDSVIGILNIPKINLEVAIKEGSDKETLKYSVGHFEQTVMPGENGNFAVAGHSDYTSNKFFSDLYKLEIGDQINVLSHGKTYYYKVNSIEVVEPSEVNVINTIDKTKKEITLVTCTPKFVGSHRLIVKGVI